MKLSILIPTLPERFPYLKRLRQVLDPQVSKYADRVELKLNDAGRHMTTGRKRNDLIQNSLGEYFIQCDDDDLVPDYYVKELLTAIDKNPDVVTFTGYMTTNGGNKKNFVIKLGESYEERNGVYYRFPNHLCCYKRSVVREIKFQDITIQEDYKWADEVRRKGLLKTEVHIDRDMYHYDYRNKKALR